MTRYIKGKDGKFAGSIGSGKTRVPTPAPAIATSKPRVLPFLDVPQPEAQRDIDSAVKQTLASIELLEAFQRKNPNRDGSDTLDIQALKKVMFDNSKKYLVVSLTAEQAGLSRQARVASTLNRLLMTRLDQHDRDRALLVDEDHIDRVHSGETDSERFTRCKESCSTHQPISEIKTHLTALASGAVLSDHLATAGGDAEAAAVVASLLPNMWK